jgi:hypothetical protein
LAVVPLADFIIFRNYVSVTEGMQEPAQDIVRQAMADLQIIYLLYFPKFNCGLPPGIFGLDLDIVG